MVYSYLNNVQNVVQICLGEYAMKKNVKQDIINVTIELINEKGSNIEDITIRDICNSANIGTGLINYHFQSKDNLIACCVQIMVGDVIARFEEMQQAQNEGTPVERLRIMTKLTCDYLQANENISRISMLTDYLNSTAIDNTSQTIEAYLPLVKAVCPIDMEHDEVVFKTNMLILSLQTFFLRRKVQVKYIGLDFHDKVQRDKIIDKIINTTLGLGDAKNETLID